MEPEELKVGGTYYVRVKVDSKDSRGVYCLLVDDAGYGKKALSFYNWMLYSFIPVPPAPKYDPCRLFRAGDRVTPKVVNGRDFNNIAEEMKGKVLIVTQDENRLCNVYVRDGEDEFTIDPAYLELVKPVEELEPYSMGESSDYFSVDKDDDELCLYWKDKHPHAKEAAEAECSRLNAEYRKELA